MHEFAVLLGFDKDSEDLLLALQNEVGRAINNTFMAENNMLPHITLSLFTSENAEETARIIEQFAGNIEDFQVRLASVGVFNTPLAVVNLLPVVTRRLLDLHDDLIHRLQPVSTMFQSYYLVPDWVPHCSAAINIEPDQLGAAVEAVCARFVPRDVKIAYVTLAECCPYRENGRWPVGR